MMSLSLMELCYYVIVDGVEVFFSEFVSLEWRSLRMRNAATVTDIASRLVSFIAHRIYYEEVLITKF